MNKCKANTLLASREAGRNSMSHNLLSELVKLLSLQWFGEEISDHFRSGAIFNRQVALLDLICKEEITNVYGAGALAGAFLTIFEEQNSVLVVLSHNNIWLISYLNQSGCCCWLSWFWIESY